MERSIPRIGFVGAGRVGRALAASFSRAGLRVTAAYSRSSASASALAAGIDGCTAHFGGAAFVEECELAFLTVPDGAIAEVAAAIPWRAGMGVVHASGATEVTALEAAGARGCGIGGFHPALHMGSASVGPEEWARAVVAIEADGKLRHVLEAIAQRLGARALLLPHGSRAAYHAACGYATQFVNALAFEAERMMVRAGIDADMARMALSGLLHSTTQAISDAGPAATLPGPVSRGDTETLRRQLKAVHAAGRAEEELFIQLCLRTVAIAEETGAIPHERAHAMRLLLHARQGHAAG